MVGFIGQYLLRELPKRGYRLRVLLRRPASVPMQTASAVIGDLSRPQNMSTALERTRDVSMSVVQVSDAAAKTDQVASAVLNAGGALEARSGKLRAEVERFLAQVRVA